jgi:hypothetical protein
MPKFRRLRKAGKIDLANPLHRWLVYFDETAPREMIEEVIDMDTAIGKVQNVMDMIQRDPAMLRAYEGYAKAESDRVSEINAAVAEYKAQLSAMQRENAALRAQLAAK